MLRAVSSVLAALACGLLGDPVAPDASVTDAPRMEHGHEAPAKSAPSRASACMRRAKRPPIASAISAWRRASRK